MKLTYLFPVAFLLLVISYSCKMQKEPEVRHFNYYKPVFDQTRKVFVKTPSYKHVHLDTMVKILSNLRNEIYEIKDTFLIDDEFEYSSGEMIIDVDLINEKPPVYDTVLVVKDFLFSRKMVDLYFPVIPDSVRMAIQTMNDSITGQETNLLPDSVQLSVIDSVADAHSLTNDSTWYEITHNSYVERVPVKKQASDTTIRVQKPLKLIYTRADILADTTRDLFQADSILSDFQSKIFWDVGDSIPYFDGFNPYLLDSMLLMITDTVRVRIIDPEREPKQYPLEKVSRNIVQRKMVSSQYFYDDELVFLVYYKGEEDVFVPMVKVQGGSFKIGSNDFDENEQPEYKISVSDFLIGKYEITNRIFCSFLNYMHCDSDGYITGLKVINLKPRLSKIKCDHHTGRFYTLVGYEDYPVVDVTWAGASYFCKKMGGSLPSEAEWEYAAKGGIYAVRYYVGRDRSDYEYEFRYAGSNYMSDVGWFVDNSGGDCQQVGGLMSNQLGLYDMCGNVWEWCYDNYDKDFYKRNSKSQNPVCINGSGVRVCRGGSWSSDAQYCRVTNRNYLDEFDENKFLGFRFKCEWHR